MTNPETDVSVGVHSSNLNEELGQVQYVFSDKTGTFVLDNMEFKYLNIMGKVLVNNLFKLPSTQAKHSIPGDDRSYEKPESLPKVTNVDFLDADFFEEKESPNSALYEPIQYLSKNRKKRIFSFSSLTLVRIYVCFRSVILSTQERKKGEVTYNVINPLIREGIIYIYLI